MPVNKTTDENKQPESQPVNPAPSLNDNEDIAINMTGLYDCDEKTVLYYLKNASNYSGGLMRPEKARTQLKNLYAKIERSIPFFKLLYDSLWTEETRMILKVFNAYLKDKNNAEQDSLSEVQTKLIELMQQIIINRPLIRAELIRHLTHERRLKKILRLKNGKDEIISDLESEIPE